MGILFILRSSSETNFWLLELSMEILPAKILPIEKEFIRPIFSHIFVTYKNSS